MTFRERFSLDTGAAGAPRILSGHNFREVAPEILSPLSWSVIGAGMEQGFRQLASNVRVPFPETSPMFVSYLAFRPFHVLSSVDRLLRGLPGIDRRDPWELLFGGAPPSGGDVPARPLPTQVLGTVRQVAVLRRNGRLLGEVAEMVAAAEIEYLRASERSGRWGLGEAAAKAIEAGRAAWALHCRTTSAMVGAAAFLRRALAPRHEPEEARLLVAAAARRAADEVVSSAEPGLIDEDVAHLSCYEVASFEGRFAAQVLLHESSHGGAPGAAIDVEVPSGSPLASVYDRLVRLLRLCVAEREQSKNLGLRALHCLRLLLRSGLSDLPPDDAALLGAGELRDLDVGAQQTLVKQRTEELDVARELDVPIDLRQTRRGVEGLPRRRSAQADQGVPLAPGWAEGRSMWLDDAGDDAGDILCGHCVDGNHVLAVQPAAVVTGIGSLLSHVAIVCRELGIPLVAGVEVGRDSRPLTVDGWTGTVTHVRAQ